MEALAEMMTTPGISRDLPVQNLRARSLSSDGYCQPDPDDCPNPPDCDCPDCL